MTNFDTDSFSEADLGAEFDRLFPQGFAGPDVLQELAPAGWENSPLLAVFHPSLAQSYEETLRLHRNVCALRRPNDRHPLPLEPTFDEVARDFRERPVETVREVRELVGQCLWDLFSDGHQVTATDGRVLDLGSSRARSLSGYPPLSHTLSDQSVQDDSMREQWWFHPIAAA